MEMQNSAMTHLMSTQTSILEEIRDLRRKEDMRSQFSNLSSNAADIPTGGQAPVNMSSQTTDMAMNTISMQEPSAQIDLYRGEQYYDTMQPTPVSMAMPSNPLSYESVSTLPVVGGVAGMAQTVAKDAVTYDRSRMSKEATAELFAQRSQGFQLGTVETAGKVAETVGTASGFMIGGLVGGLAVGSVVGGATAMVAGSMVDGAKSSLNYQDILRKDGYKAFNALESTTEYGGIGINLDEQQEMSSYLRDLSTDNFMDDAEMGEILQGSLDNKLLKSVSDIASFKEKFSKIVEGVKEISLTLNSTIEEAVEFMGEMERRGVTTDKMANVAATGKVAASFLGVDANENMQQVMSQTDSIVSGSAMNAENVMGGIGYNSYLLTAIEDISREGDGVNRQYIKNSGGAGAVSGEMESVMRGYYQGAGQDKLLGMFGSAFTQDDNGNFSLDDDRLNALLNSGMDQRELMNQSSEYMRSLDTTDQAKLARSAGQIFNQSADSNALMGVSKAIQEQFQSEMGIDADPETALVAMGMTGDDMQARVLSELLTAGTDSDASNQFAALSMKEQMDSSRNADAPGMWKRIKYGFEKKVTNPLGDMGQFISDGVGDIGQDIQMSTAGIDKNGRMGGDILGEITSESIEQKFTGAESNSAQIQNVLKELNPNLKSDYGEEIIKKESSQLVDFTSGEFKRLIDEIKSGQMSGADIADLKKNLDDGVYNKDTAQQVQYALNSASGEYDGWGKLKQPFAYSSSMFEMGTWASDYEGGKEKGDFKSMEEIQKQEKGLKTDIEKSSKELNKIMASGENIGVNTDDYKELEEKIRSGDVASVEGMTSNKDVIKIAKDFERHTEVRDGIGKASDLYTDMFRTTQGTIEMTSGIFDLIGASGIYTDEEFDYYFGADKKEFNKQKKKDVGKNYKKLDKKTDQELANLSEEYIERGEQMFATLSPNKMTELANYVLESTPSLHAEDLYKEGSETIDSKKLYESFMDVSRVQQSSESAAEKSITDNQAAIDATKNHEEAMSEFVSTFVAESAMLRQAMEDMKTKNTGKYTSISN